MAPTYVELLGQRGRVVGAPLPLGAGDLVQQPPRLVALGRVGQALLERALCGPDGRRRVGTIGCRVTGSARGAAPACTGAGVRSGLGGRGWSPERGRRGRRARRTLDGWGEHRPAGAGRLRHLGRRRGRQRQALAQPGPGQQPSQRQRRGGQACSSQVKIRWSRSAPSPARRPDRAADGDDGGSDHDGAGQQHESDGDAARRREPRRRRDPQARPPAPAPATAAPGRT